MTYKQFSIRNRKYLGVWKTGRRGLFALIPLKDKVLEKYRQEAEEDNYDEALDLIDNIEDTQGIMEQLVAEEKYPEIKDLLADYKKMFSELDDMMEEKTYFIDWDTRDDWTT